MRGMGNRFSKAFRDRFPEAQGVRREPGGNHLYCVHCRRRHHALQDVKLHCVHVLAYLAREHAWNEEHPK